jgi:hypothetical protein
MRSTTRIPPRTPSRIIARKITRIITVTTLSLALAGLTFAAAANPPPELLQLEREVSLKMAHARDEGFTDAAKLKTLADAQAVDAEGEKALKAGEYERAENDFLQARVLLHNLGI